MPGTGILFLLNLCMVKTANTRSKMILATAVTIQSFMGYARNGITLKSYAEDPKTPKEIKDLIARIADTLLCKVSVAKAISVEVTTASAAYLSRMAALAYTRRHVLGLMARPKGQSFKGSPDKQVSRVAEILDIDIATSEGRQRFYSIAKLTHPAYEVFPGMAYYDHRKKLTRPRLRIVPVRADGSPLREGTGWLSMLDTLEEAVRREGGSAELRGIARMLVRMQDFEAMGPPGLSTHTRKFLWL